MLLRFRLAVPLSLLALALPARADSALKVGAVFPISGAQSTYGEESLNGMDMALDDLKAQDAALASKITVVKEDEKSNPIDAATAVKKVLNVDKVDVVFGSVASSNTISMTSAAI